MNQILIFKNELINNEKAIIKKGERFSHLQNILKIKKNDHLKVFVLDEYKSQAVVEEITDEEIILQLGMKEPSLSSWCNLIIGLSRPPTCQKIIEHGSSMGISSFQFFKADLSEKSYKDSKLFSEEKFLNHMDLGLMQSGRFIKRPTLKVHSGLKDITFNPFEKFILSPTAKDNFLNYYSKNKMMVKNPTLVIGPERGFTEKELTYFKDMGFIEINISESILRVEIATFAAVGQLELLKASAEYL